MTEQELANVIWDIKEIIRNSYDDSEVEELNQSAESKMLLDRNLLDAIIALPKNLFDYDDFLYTNVAVRRLLRSSDDILAELASLDKEMETELALLKMEE